MQTSSCPDNGHEPPTADLVTVDPAVVGDGPLDANECRSACATVGDGQVVTCVRQSSDSVFCIAQPFPCEGRRPHGLKESMLRFEKNGFSRHLADAAWLEAASVDAFRRLRRELEAHGAPRRLIRAASQSARDERRHARTARALARRFGVSVPRVDCAPFERRSLFDLALENAVEGCVRETWGALVAMRQAERAEDLGVRAAMAGIARDELRHAELAWRIDRWLAPRLTREHRQKVGEARQSAVNQLKNELAQELGLSERQRLGLPGAHEAHLMLVELDRALRMSARSGAS
jgi:rubrerythrin